MEAYTIAPLPPLFHLSSHSQLSNELPEFCPLFFVPPLEDRPQNPIVEALEDSPSLPQPTEHEEDTFIAGSGEEPQQEEVVDEADIWTTKEVVAETRAPKVQFSACARLSTVLFLFF
jgi:hypothetical protein